MWIPVVKYTHFIIIELSQYIMADPIWYLHARAKQFQLGFDLIGGSIPTCARLTSHFQMPEI